MSDRLFPAYRFDGRHALAVPACVRVEDGFLIVEDMDRQPLDREAIASVTVFDPYLDAPRLVVLRSGATLEVRDEDRRFARALESAGLAPSRVVRLQSRWPAALVAVAAVLLLCVAAYLEGLPRVTRWAAFALPPQLESRLGQGLLEMLDEHGFTPSELDESERTWISERFSRAAEAAAPGVSYQLEFRQMSTGVINAFTLPGGVIVMLDATVEFGAAIDDDVVLGVLGHELGHVVHKHATRSVLQALGIGSIGSLLWGDFSGAAASVPVLLGQLSYSRSFESEADDFAVELLRHQQLSAQPLSRFFACLQERPEQRFAAAIPSFMSSHPPTEERLARVQALDGDSALRCPADD